MKHRTTIEIDQELLDQARELLGTSGIRETDQARLEILFSARSAADYARLAMLLAAHSVTRGTCRVGDPLT